MFLFGHGATMTMCSLVFLLGRLYWYVRVFLQIQLERVLDVDEVEGEETRLLVKWAGAPYSACTYELVKDLEHAGQVHDLGRKIVSCRARR